MNFTFKAIAAAGALVAATSGHAANVFTNATGNSSLVLFAFNPTTKSYYAEDLGYRLNDFLPSSVTTSAPDGGGTAIAGTKTPEAGLNKVWAADSTFTTWLNTTQGGVTTGLKWQVVAGDSLSDTVASQDFSRTVISSAVALSPTNQIVRNSLGTTSGASFVAGVGTPLGGSKVGTYSATAFSNGNAFGATTLGSFGSSLALYYLTTTDTANEPTGSDPATVVKFGNSANFATLTLAANGTLTYNLDPAPVSNVPLPDSVWLMGAGLASIGGFIRRRKAVAQA